MCIFKFTTIKKCKKGDNRMRTCLRCGSEMQENCAVKVEGAGYGIVLSNNADKLFGGRIGQPRVAICPQCGEVSIYLADTDRLQKP